jgi:hypothetical protein
VNTHDVFFNDRKKGEHDVRGKNAVVHKYGEIIRSIMWWFKEN